MTRTAPPPFVAFYRVAPGHHVARFPVVPVKGRSHPILGLSRTAGGAPVVDTDAIHAFTQAEIDVHGRYYERCVAEGSLSPSTAEAFAKQGADELAAEKKPDTEPVTVKPARPEGAVS